MQNKKEERINKWRIIYEFTILLLVLFQSCSSSPSLRACANEWAWQNGHVTCRYGSLGSVPRVGTRVVFRHLIWNVFYFLTLLFFLFWFSFSANAFAIGSKRTLKISRRGGWDSKCTLTQSWGSRVCVCGWGAWGGQFGWVGEGQAALSRLCPTATSGGTPVYYRQLCDPDHTLISPRHPHQFLQQFWTARIHTPGPADLDLLPTSQSFLCFLCFFFMGKVLIKYWFACITSCPLSCPTSGKHQQQPVTFCFFLTLRLITQPVRLVRTHYSILWHPTPNPPPPFLSPPLIPAHLSPPLYF